MYYSGWKWENLGVFSSDFEKIGQSVKQCYIPPYFLEKYTYFS